MFKSLKTVFRSPKQIEVSSPLTGTAIALSAVADKTFAEEILGKGIAVVPSEGKLYAPVDGRIAVLTDSLHAIALIGKDNLEILIHIGLDTVELGGEHFEAHVTVGNSVKKGDLLVTFDIPALKAEGYDITSPIIITNTIKFASVKAQAKGEVNVGEPLLIVKNK